MKFKWTIPNILSLYRLFMCPVILYLIFSGHEKLFVVLFIINLITDVLDGFIARRFNQQSEIGVLLDSWADVGSYLIAICGLIWFHPYIFHDYGWWIGTYLFFYLGQMLLSRIRFGKWVAGWHAYSVKITGYSHALFFLVLFTYGFVEWFFYAVMIAGYICETELVILDIICEKPIHNVKGLYWHLKKKNKA